MKRLRILVFFGILLMGTMLIGCTQQQGGAPASPNQSSAASAGQNATAGTTPPASNLTPPADEAAGWKQYKQATFSFDYPDGLETQESLGSYQEGRGYAVVILQNENLDDPTLIVYYVRYGSLSSNLSAKDIAKAFLESDNSSREDTMGVLHLAAFKGGISTYTTGNGYGAADMAFTMNDPKSGMTLNGYAVQVYDPATTVGIKARILAVDEETAKDARDRFLESLKIGNPQ